MEFNKNPCSQDLVCIAKFLPYIDIPFFKGLHAHNCPNGGRFPGPIMADKAVNIPRANTRTRRKIANRESIINQKGEHYAGLSPHGLHVSHVVVIEAGAQLSEVAD